MMKASSLTEHLNILNLNKVVSLILIITKLRHFDFSPHLDYYYSNFILLGNKIKFCLMVYI